MSCGIKKKTKRVVLLTFVQLSVEIKSFDNPITELLFPSIVEEEGESVMYKRGASVCTFIDKTMKLNPRPQKIS